MADSARSPGGGRLTQLLHALAFQAVWAACVLGAARGLGWLGPLAGAVFLAGSLAASRRRGPEARLLLQAALVGGLLDSLLSAGGVLRFAAPGPAPWLAPAWIVVLWASFASLLPRSLAWLRSRLALAALVGALAGPSTYLSAARLGAAELLVPWPTAALAVGVEYGLALPLLAFLARGSARAPEARRSARADRS